MLPVLFDASGASVHLLDLAQQLLLLIFECLQNALGLRLGEFFWIRRLLLLLFILLLLLVLTLLLLVALLPLFVLLLFLLLIRILRLIRALLLFVLGLLLILLLIFLALVGPIARRVPPPQPDGCPPLEIKMPPGT